MCRDIELSWHLEDSCIVVGVVVDKSLSVVFDLPTWWSRVIVSIEEGH